ncbi:type II toxin-antitoxin system RelE/ParE family toxin [Nostoc sp. LPT]|uniref:type II toxin-antitoxin system RelE/ParE family toxin n=1 Tax=Nostoc sp. LPT TaxID=2815387 RepID=UPI001D4C0D0C|nr:type II toxin-antitoxin system RelE/ParE family toxin [Nostoc sp. LPT]MBN4004777.1 type II toxin-antitoxin system RelE/ParE family toxin [Nostoc sp. LPT]
MIQKAKENYSPIRFDVVDATNFQVKQPSAQRLVERLTQRFEQIAQFPLSGRIVPEFETKQIREVIEGSYRIIYYIKSDQIDVLAVLHGFQQIESIIDET